MTTGGRVCCPGPGRRAGPRQGRGNRRRRPTNKVAGSASPGRAAFALVGYLSSAPRGAVGSGQRTALFRRYSMRRAAFAFLGVGLLAATGAAGNPGGKAGKKDEDKVQGTWSVVSGEKEGKKVPEGEFKDFKVTFGAGGKLTASHDGKDVEATYKLDPAKKPRQIDVTISEGGMDQLFKGI